MNSRLNGNASLVAEYIDELRKTTGDSQGEIARKLGVSPAFLSAVVNGKKRPSLNMGKKIDHVYGLQAVINGYTAVDYINACNGSIELPELDSQKRAMELSKLTNAAVGALSETIKNDGDFSGEKYVEIDGRTYKISISKE